MSLETAYRLKERSDRVRHLFHNRSLLSFGLFHKICLAFFVAIIPILTVGYLIVINGERTIRHEIESSLLSRVHFYLNELTLELEHIVNLKREYIFDQDIQRLSVLSSAMTDYERRVAIFGIQKKVQTLKSSSSYIEDVRLYMVSEDKIVQPTQILFHISDAQKSIHGSLGLKEYPIVQRNDQLIMVERFPTGNYSDGSLPVYWMEIVLNRSKIESALSQMLSENGAGAILSDIRHKWSLFGDNGDDTLSKEMTRAIDRADGSSESGQRLLKIRNDSYIVADEQSPSYGVALTVYVPEKVVLEPLALYQKWFRILIATAMVIVVLFAYWIYLFLQRPLQRLIRAFRKVKDGAFDVQLIHKNPDEIQYLYDQFNQMVGTIQSLIRDVYEQGIRSQRSELRHLQAQINPHFLYNTYYRLHRLVQDEDIENMKVYTRLLGDYLKYITRNGQDEATLGMEIDHSRTYADILKMRFRNKLELEWEDLPDDLAAIPIPRLIVQPVVENAFEHALEEMEDVGRLRFAIFRDDEYVTIRIEDNGDRLTNRKLDELKERLQSTREDMETTGILNVHRRLQLKFGEAFGIGIARSELGGLRVEIRIPHTHKEGDHTNVSAIDRG
ncbi:sensor histidine kinase [Cohnella soli]|uniref:Sensor histidine kinase n=1 Tax=Cohnella soli TaxID=425005 RepID=A0ABW0HXR0_9BACL